VNEAIVHRLAEIEKVMPRSQVVKHEGVDEGVKV
jgi:hypothetical protein